MMIAHQGKVAPSMLRLGSPCWTFLLLEVVLVTQLVFVDTTDAFRKPRSVVRIMIASSACK